LTKAVAVGERGDGYMSVHGGMMERFRWLGGGECGVWLPNFCGKRVREEGRCSWYMCFG